MPDEDRINTQSSPFSKIWFALNHVRAWRPSFYHRIGGHDPLRKNIDDHDLLCRTYALYCCWPSAACCATTAIPWNAASA